MSCVNGSSNINDFSPRTSITFRDSIVLDTGCSIMMVSPPSNYDLNLVSYPFTPFPEVKIKPDPLISGNTVILSFILNLYWNIDSISGYYYFFFEICLIPFPLSLNLSLLNFIYMFFPIYYM